ncbi:Integral membrane protein [Neofusicoccum parvum]|uniref:Integral membrane protein n=1 Tax=Neofusicoccum parvum TaxID=310453 RepID=A0ACB5RTF7_9PEZI|nr:Integral membrane protein [Neofusicoccum parvum]
MGGGLRPPQSLLVEWATDREKYPYGERRGPTMIILLAVLLAMTLTVVGARLWARCKVRRNAGLDDWLIVAALPVLLCYDACHVLGFFLYGIDRHAWEVTVPMAVNVRIVTWGISCSYMIITSLVKISILCFYRRLSEGSVTRSWIWIVRGFMGFVIAYAFVFTLMLFVDCRPFDAFWNKLNPQWALAHNYTCFNEGADFIASAVVSVIQDAAVCILPLLVVRRLQMPRKQKLALAGLFGVGFFLCFCGIMRVAYMYIIYYKTYDTTWEAFPVWSWTLVETHFAIMCASAPALKLFFRRMLAPTSIDSYTNRQRAEYNNFGSGSGGGKNGTGRSKPDDAEIYMEDMIAYRAARAAADQAEKDSPIFAVFPERRGTKDGANITVTQEVDVIFSQRRSDNGDALSGAETASKGPSRASNESLLEDPFAGGR